MRNVNRRTLDHIGAKAFYFLALAYEKQGLLTQIRPLIFDAYKTSCLNKDQIGQATLMNIIIRSYLAQNLYE